MNRLPQYVRWCAMVASGAVVFQAAGCDISPILQVVNTVFLGVTAVASYMIIQNI